MTLLGTCTTRRFFSIRTWSPSHALFSPRFGNKFLPILPPSCTPQRQHTTIYRKLAHSPRKSDPIVHEQFVKRLTFALRKHVGAEHGIDSRNDGYVSLNELLSHPEFRDFSLPELQRILDLDEKYRFQIMFDPSYRESAWWIRAKMWSESYRYLKPLKSGKGPSQAVYKTTEEQWLTHLSRNGIPKQNDDWIRLECCINTDDYLNDLEPRDEVFIFVDVEQCLKSGIRFFYPIPPPQPLANPTHLLTKGDQYGYISANLFAQVDQLQTKKKLIWGDEDLLNVTAFPPFASSDEEKRNRRTFLKPLYYNFTTFARLSSYHSSRTPPEVIQEAKDVVETV